MARRRSACPRCGTASLHTRLARSCRLLPRRRVPRAATLRRLTDHLRCRHPGIVTDVSACIDCGAPGGRIALPRKAGLRRRCSRSGSTGRASSPARPGRKHERAIDARTPAGGGRPRTTLPPPAGLFHSTGAGSTTGRGKRSAGNPKVYRYPRWQFTNASSDIPRAVLLGLDLADIPWRRSNHRVIGVCRVVPAAVARLDELVGLKA